MGGYAEQRVDRPYHRVYDPAADERAALAELPRGANHAGVPVLYRGRIHCMGGKGTNRVFGTHETYDPASDGWASYAPMRTPRHGTGAAAMGDFIHVAGGGPIVGGGVKSAVHEAFTLG